MQYAGLSPAEADASERERGKAICDYLDRAGIRTPRAAGELVIDVGCGLGGAAAVFAERGARAVGIDVVSLDWSLARKYGVEFAESLAAAARGAGKTDLVLYVHTLQHVLDLNAALQELREFVSPQTLVYIEVPGVKHLAPYDDDLLQYLQNAHVYHFSLETLPQVMERAGFGRHCGDETVRSVFPAGKRTLVGPAPKRLLFVED